jgi:hypothetical protein
MAIIIEVSGKKTLSMARASKSFKIRVNTRVSFGMERRRVLDDWSILASRFMKANSQTTKWTGVVFTPGTMKGNTMGVGCRTRCTARGVLSGRMAKSMRAVM